MLVMKISYTKSVCLSLGDVEITYYNSHEENERTEIIEKQRRTHFLYGGHSTKDKKKLSAFYFSF